MITLLLGFFYLCLALAMECLQAGRLLLLAFQTIDGRSRRLRADLARKLAPPDPRFDRHFTL